MRKHGTDLWLENLGDNADVSRGWETVKENIRISAKENLGY
jgi:hypothetical protein